jgi:hypothetical protein
MSKNKYYLIVNLSNLIRKAEGISHGCLDQQKIIYNYEDRTNDSILRFVGGDHKDENKLFLICSPSSKKEIINNISKTLGNSLTYIKSYEKRLKRFSLSNRDMSCLNVSMNAFVGIKDINEVKQLLFGDSSLKPPVPMLVEIIDEIESRTKEYSSSKLSKEELFNVGTNLYLENDDVFSEVGYTLLVNLHNSLSEYSKGKKKHTKTEEENNLRDKIQRLLKEKPW